jgi:LysM repeat protein
MTDNGFVWHDNYSRNNNKEEGNLESNENIAYETAIEEYRKKYSRFLKIAAVVLSIFIILFTVLIFRSRNLADKKQVETIEKRLDRLEAEFISLKTYIASKLDQAIKEMERDRRSTTTKKVSPVKKPPTEQKEQEVLTPKVHKVLPGESLSRISRYYGLTIDQLRVYNNLDSNSIIYPGQELKLTP